MSHATPPLTGAFLSMATGGARGAKSFAAGDFPAQPRRVLIAERTASARLGWEAQCLALQAFLAENGGRYPSRRRAAALVRPPAPSYFRCA